MSGKSRYIVDTRPPRLDLERAKRGPSAADLREIPPTTRADWEDAEVLIPIDEETYREFLAFQAERAKKRAIR